MKPELNKKLLEKRETIKKIKYNREDDDGRKFLIVHIIWLFLVVFLVFTGAIYITYLRDLPSIKSLGESVLPQSTVIYDRNGNELYNLYSKEKRTYVDYSNISQMMKNAIVSTEDKTFFDNSGFDFKGLIRAGGNYILGKSDKIQGTSTISQQLIKVSFLTSERSIKRKVQEIYLSYKLNSNYTKEKILEMYLNKIPFGSNAFGIEEAAKTFFGKSAKDIGILEGSILASIPKGPTYYSPYTHSDRLMGYVYAYKEDTPKDIIRIADTENPTFYKPLIDKLKAIMQDMDIKKVSDSTYKVCSLDSKFFKKDYKIDSDGCVTIDSSKFMELLNSIKIAYDNLELEKPNEDLSGYVLEYNTGRKDFVLGRMLEDEKIKVEEYKKALIDSLDFKFKKYAENIKYPYFVFYVKEYIEDKYGKEFGEQGGLKIYTTLDPKMQDKAEELVKKQVAINKEKYGASNAALVSMDNRNGQIIAMVGGVDYFAEGKGSNVNIITSERQPGSSFKPIVYLNAISKKPVSPDTPIYDSDTSFGSWNPDNYDKKYLGLMPVRKALDYSRNIPAIKMFFFGGGEDTIIKFANSLGILSLKLGMSYGGPLAIGTGELKPLELLQAYSVMANMGKKRNITPILRIEDKKGNIIYGERKNEGEQIVSEAACYVLSKILSDASSRPNSYWNNVLTLGDRPVAAKTGTSNKDVSKGKKKEILPGDLWTAGYTPQITTVVWAGNTDGSATKGTCDGLNCAAPIWHDFMEFAHKGLEKKKFDEPEGVVHATISKMSGKLASKSTPSEFKVSSIFAVKPTDFDGGYKGVEVDSLCNGLVTEDTPKEAIKTIYTGTSAAPLIDSFDKSWLKSIGKYQSLGSSDAGVNSSDSIKDTPCERPSKNTAGISISSTINDGSNIGEGVKPIEIRFDANNPIILVTITLDGEVIKSIPIKEQLSGNLNEEIDIKGTGGHKIIIKAIDKYYYDGKITYNINGAQGETQVENIPEVSNGTDVPNSATTDTNNSSGDGELTPVITMTNPAEGVKSLKIYNDQSVNIRGQISGATSIDAINIYLNGQLFKILDGSSSFVIPINDAKDFDIGTYSVKIEAISSSGKSSNKIIEVKIMGR